MAVASRLLQTAAAAATISQICTRRRLRWVAKLLVAVCLLVAYVAVLLRESLQGLEQQQQQQQSRESGWETTERRKTEEAVRLIAQGVKQLRNNSWNTLLHRRSKAVRKMNPENVKKQLLRVSNWEATRHRRKESVAKTYTEISRQIKISTAKSGQRNDDDNDDDDDAAHDNAHRTPASEMTTVNPIYEYSAEQNAATEAELHKRHEVLMQACARRASGDRRSPLPPPNAWEFFVSPGHGLAWCNVFKAASSTWLYYFNILAGYDPTFLQRTKRPPLEMARQHFPRPTRSELAEAMQSSVSFLIVREPFERLLSAYRDKLEGQHNKYYRTLGAKIARRFRKTYKPHGGGPTFNEFVQHVIASHKDPAEQTKPTETTADAHRQRKTSKDQTPKVVDEHWRPISEFCTPCSLNYTLVAKVETFRRDTEYIIRLAGLETLLFNKLPDRRQMAIGNRAPERTADIVPKYFAQLNSDQLRDLLEIYGADFELFGYDSSKYHGLVQQSPIVGATSSAPANDSQIPPFAQSTPTNP